ncbi:MULTISPECIES: beta-propeller domain-containing protein [unclassified Bacillus (in: firmicutes)]|uniref:beta-propeller domain-containing protein n=1 Tax=unclassified Bacillus (in: firmicutes) TaxID=185979 RepID=UPI0008F0776C|nr:MULTISPECIES: beta-propeller domain-containing protein [unclassified Bacillus (in: firmicutes)]SFA71329.1 Secreted protein containing C-terminal beta-propeller domain [Bacillus sp. UNCCL13]SFQ61500.1 Secreted protein containing C-terminal beta-propeller domain [Bacillus sp. cl95]
MKKYWTVGGIILVFTALIVLYFFTQLKIVNAWDANEVKVVLTNKVWKIHFSEKITKSSLKPSLIYVTDDKGLKIKNELFLSDDQKTLYIGPPEKGYSLESKMYTLHLEKGIKSTLGRNLLLSKKLMFIVKETLPTIGSKSKLNQYFLSVLDDEKKRQGFFGGGVKEDAKSSGDMANSEGVAKQDVSETNVQVQGIDEADVVKTDGNLIYQASQNRIDIIQALPDMKKVSTIVYTNEFMPAQLFLHEKQLIVLGHHYGYEEKTKKEMATADMIAPMHDSLEVLIYDMSKPEKPKQIRKITLEGSLSAARKMDGMIYLVTNHSPDYWMLNENEEIDIRPKYFDSAANSEMKAVDYKKIHYFPDSKATNYTMIAAFDLNQPKMEANVSTYLGSGDQMYMSKKNIYIAVQNAFEEPVEDMTKMVAPDTNIYKFSVDGMNVKFHSSAEVEGTVLNQFSMDEHDGYFRLVTTKGFAWDETQPSTNQLFILDEKLKMAGKLEQLARGERIYSARFMGDRIYMVTFKETDPLFVIDAKDPKQPKVLGELKIPGFSNYLHPYDENHIIGFGQDTKIMDDKNSTTGPRIITDGMKISLFDVTDLNHPEEKFTEIIGGRGTYSPLNYDHKALLFNKNTNMYAFPISVYRNHETNEYEQIFEFQGAYVYNIDPLNGIKLKAKLTHVKELPIYEEYGTGITRMVYIGETLYALSPDKITAHNMKDFKQIGELSLFDANASK